MKKTKKTTLLASLGSGLEYYDFVIYAMMAEPLSALFFSSDHSALGLMKTFGIFAVGYLIRPLGGVLFGTIGDTYGRKKTFLGVMLLMAAATFLIGLLPTYKDVGLLAPCLLLFLRLVQGLSFGAELPGAMTVIAESTEKKRRATHSGFVISSVSLGASFASLLLFLLSQSVSRPDILAFGWRLPFLLGGVFAIANYFIRKHLTETPEFAQLQTERHAVAETPSLKNPLLSLLKHHKKDLFLGIGMTSFCASLVIFSLYIPVYLSTYFQVPQSDVYFALTLGMLWSAVSLPLCGWLADRQGRVVTYLFTSIAFALCAFSLFRLLSGAGMGSLIGFMVLYQTVVSFATASYFPLLAALFPTPTRYTGVALCYNVTYSIMGCAPLAVTALINSFHMPSIGIWFLVASALVGAISSAFLAKRQSIVAFERGI